MGMNFFNRSTVDRETAQISPMIHAAQAGDLTAYNRLVLQYQDTAYNLAQWALENEQSAMEATQRAFVQAYQGLGRYRGGSFRAWLLHFVVKNCLKQVRRSPNGKGNHRELGKDSMPVHDLPAHLRMALLLVDIEGLSCSEAAEILGMPVNRFNRSLAQARQSMVNAF